MKTAEEHLEEAALNLGYGDIDEMLIVEPYSVVKSIVLSRMQTYAEQFKNEWRQPDMTDESQIQNLDRLVLHFAYDSYLMYNDWNWRTDSRLPDCLFVLPSPPKTTEI